MTWLTFALLLQNLLETLAVPRWYERGGCNTGARNVAVIDGQQRITTVAIIAAVTQWRLLKLVNQQLLVSPADIVLQHKAIKVWALSVCLPAGALHECETLEKPPPHSRSKKLSSLVPSRVPFAAQWPASCSLFVCFGVCLIHVEQPALVMCCCLCRQSRTWKQGLHMLVLVVAAACFCFATQMGKLVWQMASLISARKMAAMLT